MREGGREGETERERERGEEGGEKGGMRRGRGREEVREKGEGEDMEEGGNCIVMNLAVLCSNLTIAFL